MKLENRKSKNIKNIKKDLDKQPKVTKSKDSVSTKKSQMSGPMAVVHPVHPAHPNTGIRGMASPEGANPVSRLAQMQARFQQKQQQEKEQKLLALYADQAQQAYARINGGGGKVRQLFQERRGLDRSYPLQPLEGRRGTSLDRGQQLRQNTTKRTNSLVRAAPPRYPSAGYDEDDYYYQPPIYTSQQRLDQDYIENNNRFYKQQAKQLQYQQHIFGDENDYFSKSYDLDSTKVFKKLPNIGGTTLAEQKVMMAPAKEQEIRKPATHIRTTKTTDPAVKSVTKAMTKLTPPSKKPEVKSTQINENKPKVGARRPTPVPISNSVITRPSTATTDKTKSEPKMAQANRTPPRAASRGPLVANSATDLKPCKICGRNFAPDRIAAHENICAKSKQKKRKVFDPIKQRLSGTGAEKYLRKGKPPPPPPSTQKKNNWRAKHEEFINNIRAAKQAQAHVAAGGKLADLPPPPPLDTSDYIQCPHCGRKFNESAAERHIPKCATMLHNKPKQGSNTRLQQVKKRY